MDIQGGEYMADDEKLIFLIQNFDYESPKEKLIRKYYDKIYAYAYRKTLNDDDALDITQEVFIKAINSLKFFDRKKASFKTWLYLIASNKISEYFRSIQYKDILDETLPSDECFERIIENKALSQQLMNYIRDLDYQSYKVVELKIFAELTFDEIGTIMMLPVSTIKTKYYTAIKKCRKEFDNNDY